jgi:hypothetical protein
MNLGLQSRGILQKEPETSRCFPGFEEHLRDLVSLATIRDFPKNNRIRTVAEILESSVKGLAQLLGQPTDRMPSGLIWYREPDPEHQGQRYRQAWPTTLGQSSPLG